MAGELTTCKSQCVRLGYTRGGDSARGRLKSSAVPSTGSRAAAGWTGVRLGPRRVRESEGPSAHTHVARPRSSARRSSTPHHSAIPVFNTEEETIHRDGSRDPEARDARSPGSALLLQERQSGRCAGRHAETAVRDPPPRKERRASASSCPAPLKEPRSPHSGQQPSVTSSARTGSKASG